MHKKVNRKRYKVNKVAVEKIDKKSKLLKFIEDSAKEYAFIMISLGFSFLGIAAIDMLNPQMFEKIVISDIQVFFLVSGIGLVVLGYMLFVTYSEKILWQKKFFKIFIMLGIMWAYLIWASDVVKYGTTSYVLGVITSLVYVCIHMLISGYQYLQNNIKDSKDRLSIIIAIFGSVVTAIALFK